MSTTRSSGATKQGAAAAPWVLRFGAGLLVLCLLFLMGLVFFSVFGHEVPCSARFMVVAILAVTAAGASSLLGGSAAAKGQIGWKGAKEHPVKFALTGGIAVLAVILFLGSGLYANQDCVDRPEVMHDTRIAGRIVGADGAPVRGARVDIPGVAGGKVDSDGVFVLQLRGVTSATPLQLSIYAEGYETFVKTLPLQAGSIDLGTLSLQPLP